MDSKAEKDSKNNELELNSIKSLQISRHGNNLERYFKNRCIRGFLQRQVIQKEINRKIKNYEFDSLVSTSKRSVTEELTKLYIHNITQLNVCHRFPSNQDWSNVSVINSHKNQEFLDLMNEYLNKKNDDDLNPSNSMKNISRFQSPSPHKKYEISPQLLKYLHKIKNKGPSSGLYNPNYNSISPHVPYTKLRPIKIKDNILKNERKSSSLTTKSNILTNVTNNDRNINKESRKKTINKSTINLLRKNSSHVMSFDKYSSRNNIFSKIQYKDTILEPVKQSRKISSPIFKKMSPRYKKKVLTQMPVIVDYNPNYAIIYDNSFRKRRLEDKLSYKAKLMRKIWSSFDATSNYQSVPPF